MSFLTCTQKSPLDPTRSLQEDVPLLTEVSASPSQIAAGGAQSAIRVKLLDEEGEPISGGLITFSSSKGSVTAEDSTDASGWAEATFTSGLTAGRAIITARYGEFSSITVEITIIPTSNPNLQIEIEEKEVLANGKDQLAVTVSVWSDAHEPVVGVFVDLSTTVGSIPAQVITDSEGKARASLTTGTSRRDTTATVTAQYDSLSVAAIITFKGIQLTAFVNPTSILADGQSTAAVTAILKETTSQVAISNEIIVFSTDLGLIPNEYMTDSRGVAQVALTSAPTEGTAHVIATYGTMASDTMMVDYISASGGQFILSDLRTSSSELLANGIDQANVQVQVIDTEQKPVPGDSIRFTASAGSLHYEWLVTNDQGLVVNTLTAQASSSDSTAIVAVYRGGGSQSLSATIDIKGVSMDMTAMPSILQADGQSQSTVAVILKKTTSQIAVSNALIQFGTNLGTIPNQALTSAEGVAQVTLTSGTALGTARIIAIYGSIITDTLDVPIVAVSPEFRTLSLITAEPRELLANGMAQSLVRARVVDSAMDPIQNVTIHFSTDQGTIDAQGLSDDDGDAFVRLIAPASESDLTATVTAQLDTQTVQTTVDLIGVEMTISASPTNILANGQSTSSIKVVLKESVSKEAVYSAPVRFSTDLGTIPSQITTDEAGVAEAFLTSATTTGTATVIARYGYTLSDTVQVSFQESIPTYLEVSTTPPVIPADGQSQSSIKATVTDANRNPIPDGTLVLFDLIEGTGSLVHQQTTIDGVATTLLTSGTLPDTARVRVSVASLADTVEVVYQVGAVNQILVSSDKDSMAADGIENANIQARVLDAQGNPLPGVTVEFSTTIGDITPTAQTNGSGIATAQFSSGKVGVATITALVSLPTGGSVVGTRTIRLLPGPPNSILLNFEPTAIGVKNTGQIQTATVEAEVRDSKNNPVVDGTFVTFSILHGPGGGETLSSTDPIPTVGGVARVSLSSGIRSGNVRVQAQVTANPIIAIAAEILIHAGEAYIEDINDITSTHLTIAAQRLNIWSVLDTTQISIMVLDKYNNPVQEGTAVYLTTSGGGVNTHTAYTDAYGKAKVVLTTGNPQPTIDRFYNYTGMQDPNFPSTAVPGFVSYPEFPGALLLPNFDANPDTFPYTYPGIRWGRVMNTEGDSTENDGISRIVAYTEGQDSTGASVRAWDWTAVCFSGPIAYAEDNSWHPHPILPGESILPDTLHPGQSATIRVCVMDGNGNPIASGSSLSTALIPEDAQARLSWTEWVTPVTMGQSYYNLTIANAINFEDPKPGWATVRIAVNSVNGDVFWTTKSVYISLD